jgi:hypothetical protein
VTAKYDTDGIDICFLNHKTFVSSVRVSRISFTLLPQVSYEGDRMHRR